MPSQPDKVIKSEEDPSLLNSPGVLTRSQLKRLSLAKVDSVRTRLDFQDKADTKNSPPSSCMSEDQRINEVTPTPVKKGKKRKELLDTIDEGSGKKTRTVQESAKKPVKPEKSKSTRKSSSGSVKKNTKITAASEPEGNQESVSSAKKKTAKAAKKKKNNKSDGDTMSLVEKLLEDVRKGLDSESTTFDDSSSQNLSKVKVEKTEAELSNKGDRGKKVARKGSKCNPEILETLVPKIEKDSPVKTNELVPTEIKKEVSPSKVKEKTAADKPARTSVNGDSEGSSVKSDSQVGKLGKRLSSVPSSTGLDAGDLVKGGSRAKKGGDGSDVTPSKVANLNKSLDISNVLYSEPKEEKLSDSSDVKQSKAANLNKSLEISNVAYCEPKDEKVCDSSDVKPSKVVNVNKSLEISDVVDSGSKASEVSDNVDVKQKKVANLNKPLGISTLPKDSEKVKMKEDYKLPINSPAAVVEEVPVADNILKPRVKLCSSPQGKVTPWTHAAAQISWQSIKLADGTSESDSDAESRKAIKESAQRRIEQNLSTSESESRFLQRIQPCLSDSDSAPECISFQAGSRAASESLKDAVQSIHRDKQRRKEKRRARLEMLKQQKEEKLIRLKEKLASQVDASCSSSEESGYEEEALKLYKYKKQPLTKAIASVEKENCVVSPELKKSFTSGEAGGDCLLQPGKEVPQNLKSLPSDILDKLPEKVYPKELKADGALSKIKKRKKEEEDCFRDGMKGVPAFKKPSTAADFIPLKSSGATKFGVVALDKLGVAPKPIASLAAEFKQNMMFGNRHKRESVKVGIAYQQKMQASGRNVFARKKF